jgi:hypothetical protein
MWEVIGPPFGWEGRLCPLELILLPDHCRTLIIFLVVLSFASSGNIITSGVVSRKRGMQFKRVHLDGCKQVRLFKIGLQHQFRLFEIG